jgi:GTP pyrophosphokinase
VAPGKETSPLGFDKEKLLEGRGKKLGDESSAVQVKGLSQILVSFAKCCNPLPGDKIIGYITKGRGVTIHGKNCPRVLETDQERRVEVTWNAHHELSRLVKIKVVCQDQPGLLAEISSAISKQKSNIRGATIVTTEDRQGISVFEVEVKSLPHVENIIRALKEIKGVFEVHRVRL